MEASDFDFENLFSIFEQSIISNIKENSYDEFLIAYSGGVDSTALLYFSKKIALKLNKKILAIHINHNLSKDSKNWEIHCRNFCKKIGVELICENLSIILDKGDSIEEKARNARYGTIYKHMNERTAMLTAHHVEDQAETFFYQLLRGAGAKGLASMPIFKILNHGFHIRPFLKFNKKELVDIVRFNKLDHINDTSNNDIKFSRNFIRKNIMPIVKNKWPNCNETISRSAFNLSESNKLNEDLAKIDFEKYFYETDNKISVNTRNLESYRFNNVIRFWIRKNNFRMPTFDQLKSIRNNIFSAGDDKTPFFSCSDFEIRRYNDYVEIMYPLSKHDASKVYTWKFKENLVISDLAINFSWRNLEDRLGFKVNRDVEVKFRRNGEGIKINNTNKSLKDFMRENKVPPWQRDRIPLIYIDKELKAIWN